jgi:protoporphyrinogen IX oxidase
MAFFFQLAVDPAAKKTLCYAAGGANRSAPRHVPAHWLARAARLRLCSAAMSGLSSHYLLLKALHVAFMVTWFAGLFYLPRLFIYHVEAKDELSRTRFTTMEKRLFAIMTIGAVLTAIFGLLTLAANPAVLQQGWFHIKLALLVGLVIYHVRCRVWIGRLEAGEAVQGTRWLRWFNEIPVVFLLAIVILAITKSP